jgi:hypothetical protein
MSDLNRATSLEQIDLHIESILNSNTTSEWLKWALRSGLQRDPIGVATDAEQLFVILAHRLEAILAESILPSPPEFIGFDLATMHPECLEPQ